MAVLFKNRSFAEIGVSTVANLINESSVDRNQFWENNSWGTFNRIQNGSAPAWLCLLVHGRLRRMLLLRLHQLFYM